jgi:hypothetical protein
VEALINLRREAKRNYKKAKAILVKALKIKVDKEVIKTMSLKKKLEVTAGYKIICDSWLLLLFSITKRKRMDH